jgi:PAS domain-containing protein
VDLLRYALAGPDAPPVLAVVTFRPAEVRARHPMHDLTGDDRIPGTSVPVRPLPDSALADLLSDTLHAGMRDSARLARSVADRTGSNPLLVEQFLHGLGQRGLLSYAPEGPTWQWQQRQVDEERPVADVHALLGPRLGGLAAETVDLLELAAVIGREVDPAVLAASLDLAPAEVTARLAAATAADLVQRRASGRLRWRHEQLRQAVLTSLGGDRRSALHLLAGRGLRASGTSALFEVVGHFNRAAELVTGAADTRQLAELNLAAGRRAAAVGAQAAACEYFAMGVDLLDGGCADLAFALYLESARAERVVGQPERAARLLDHAAAQAADDLDRARVAGVRALLRGDAGDTEAAVGYAIGVLGLFGVDLPRQPDRWPAAAGEAVGRLAGRLADEPADALAARGTRVPEWVALTVEIVADVVQLAGLRRAAIGGPGAELIIATTVELVLEHGVTPASAFLFSAQASAFARLRADADARRYALAAADLLEVFPACRYGAATRARVAIVGPAWLDAPRSMARELDAAFALAVEEGDVAAAQNISAIAAVHRFAVGAPLDRVADDLERHWRYRHQHGSEAVGDGIARLLDEAVSRLRERPPTDSSDRTAASLEAGLLSGELGYYSLAALVPLLTTGYLLGEHIQARRLSMVLGRAAELAPAGFLDAEVNFFQAVALAARCDPATGPDRAGMLAELDVRQGVLDDLAARGPGLFGARALLLSAERARLAGNVEQARSRFDRAISAARGYGFLRLEAIAAELGGRYALTRGDPGEAVAYLRRARACYQRWGGRAKVGQVDRLLADAAPAGESTRELDQLDLLTVLKAFQAISGELRRDRLVGVLLDLLVQHSSAERGCLLLPDAGGLRLAAEAHADRRRIHVDVEPPGDFDGRIPTRVVEHVMRTRQTVAGGIDEMPDLADDPYLETHQPRSLLCAPIARRNVLMGVLYLEHRRLSDAFTASYLELLEVLCTQAALSLENAAVHAQLVEAHRILDATLDPQPVGLILLGPDLAVRRVSRLAMEITGLPITPGMPLVELFDVLAPTDLADRPLRYDPGFAAVAAAAAEPINREVVIVQPTGLRRQVSASVVPLRDESGALAGVTILVAAID